MIKNYCPVCGKEMDETYMGRDYCYDCMKYLEDDDIDLVKEACKRGLVYVNGKWVDDVKNS